ncbi:MAG: GDP-mannose 4,6-dehydratase, partial [Colwellia sp.]|nr:GDP-mannose 4,6-dehydratase [Colwellia sp.]
VKELVDIAFSHVGLRWKDYVVVDPKFVRPAEVDILLGDAGKASEKLNWKPRVKFEELITMMVDHDMKLYESSK